jgi:hypothetical protein
MRIRKAEQTKESFLCDTKKKTSILGRIKVQKRVNFDVASIKLLIKKKLDPLKPIATLFTMMI